MTVFMNSRILSNNLNERAYWSKTTFLLARRRRDCCCLCVVVVFDGIVPEPTARSAVPGVSPERGTNSARLFTPGERNALAKSKVHQISRTLIMGVWVVISLISKYGCLPGVKKGKI